jgi:hypothetical protein
MMVKKIVFLVMLSTPFIFRNVINGQTAVKVLLNNSSSVRGELIDINENGDVVLKLNGRDTITIINQQIKRYDIDGYKKVKDHTNSEFYRKFKFHTEGILLLGENTGGWGLKQSVNRRIIQDLYSGITVGIDNYSGNAELNVYSIGGNARYYFSSLPNHPFVCVNSGYGRFNPQQKFNQVGGKGGLYFNPSAGFSFGNRVTFDLSVGLRFQNANVQYQLGETESDIRWKYRRLSIQFGATF